MLLPNDLTANADPPPTPRWPPGATWGWAGPRPQDRGPACIRRFPVKKDREKVPFQPGAKTFSRCTCELQRGQQAKCRLWRASAVPADRAVRQSWRGERCLLYRVRVTFENSRGTRSSGYREMQGATRQAT